VRTALPKRERAHTGRQLVPSTDDANPGIGTFHLSLDFRANGARANSRVLRR